MTKRKVFVQLSDEDDEFFDQLFETSDLDTIYTSDISSSEADFVLLYQKKIQALRQCRDFMQAIVGFSQVLLDEIDGELNDLQRVDMGNIIESAKKARTMFDDAFDIVPIFSSWTPSLEPVGVTHKLLMSIASIFNDHEKNLRISIDISDELPSVVAEEVRFKTILLYLFRLVYQFALNDTHININAHPLEDFVQIEFSIPNFTYDINTIFLSAPSEETKELFISKELIEAYSGELWFHKKATPNPTIYIKLLKYIKNDNLE